MHIFFKKNGVMVLLLSMSYDFPLLQAMAANYMKWMPF